MRNESKMKEQDKPPEKEWNKMKAGNLPDTVQNITYKDAEGI